MSRILFFISQKIDVDGFPEVETGIPNGSEYFENGSMWIIGKQKRYACLVTRHVPHPVFGESEDHRRGFFVSALTK